LYDKNNDMKYVEKWYKIRSQKIKFREIAFAKVKVLCATFWGESW